MRLVELFEDISPVVNTQMSKLGWFWFKPSTSELRIVTSPSLETDDVVETHTSYAAYTMGFLPPDKMAHEIDAVEDPEVINLAIKAGWVRGIYGTKQLDTNVGVYWDSSAKTSKELLLEGEKRNVWKTAVYLSSRIPFNKLYADFENSHIVLSGNQLEFYLKHGRTPSKMVSESIEDLKFHMDVYGFHHGQMDATWYAYRRGPHGPNDMFPGKIVGTLDFSEYGGELYIKMIEVAPDEKRKGIALALLRELKNEFEQRPSQKGEKPQKAIINWGVMTPDGVALKSAAERLGII